jgi:hypothetical protein
LAKKRLIFAKMATKKKKKKKKTKKKRTEVEVATRWQPKNKYCLDKSPAWQLPCGTNRTTDDHPPFKFNKTLDVPHVTCLDTYTVAKVHVSKKAICCAIQLLTAKAICKDAWDKTGSIIFCVSSVSLTDVNITATTQLTCNLHTV